MLFTPFKLGPVTLRNRTIRAAAFEGMCPGNKPSEDLFNYHRAVAAGGIGMTTVAYAAVDRSALSFKHQLLLDREFVPALKRLTEAIHREGAACSIQIGHCGNMAKSSVAGGRPMAPSARINLYGPTFPRTMDKDDIQKVSKSFGKAVTLAREAGFDAVEVHAGHGYLISQFLSPYTNRRHDEFGGSLINRARFMHMVMEEVKKVAGSDLAVLVKMNMRDGFNGGMELDECLEVAGMLERTGADALVLSGGFVSKAPMYVMRGSMPIKIFAHYIDECWMRFFVRHLGNFLVKEVPFNEAYFLDDALKFRTRIKLPLVYVGGLLSYEKINEVLHKGFELVAFARALIKDTDFIKKLQHDGGFHSECDICNYCIAVMYTHKAVCIQNEENPDPAIIRMMN
ncbi:MAG: NADH:flavin oxidoreductase [Bacteroidales bacterium]|nr:NADH:flavin oxidoreductase [Bacteroidales bacterium]